MPADPHIATKVIPVVDGENKPTPSPSLNSAFNDFFDKAPPPTEDEVQEAIAAPEPEIEVTEPVTDLPGQDEAPVPELPAPKATQPPPDPKAKPGKKEAKPEEKPEDKPEVKAATPPEPEDPELARYQPDSNAKPKFRQDFFHLKKLVGTYKKEAATVKGEAQTLRDEVKRRDAELDAARKALESKEIPEAIKQKLSAAEQRALDAEKRVRLLDLKQDKEFNAQYRDPIKKLHSDLLDECVKAAPDDEAIRKWADQKRGEDPDQFSERWWEEGVLNHPIFETQKLARARVERKVSELTALKADRDEKLKSFEADPERLNRYQQERAQAYWSGFYIPQATAEAERIAPTLGDWATPKDPSKAKDDGERAAFAEHNKVYKRFEESFKEHLAAINDDSENKPKSHVRVALQATKALRMEQERDEAKALAEEKEKSLLSRADELNAKDEEIRRLQEKLDKITAARSAPAKAANVQGPRNGRAANSSVETLLKQSTREAWDALMEGKV